MILPRCINSQLEQLSKDDQSTLKDWLKSQGAVLAVTVARAKGAHWELEALSRVQRRDGPEGVKVALADATEALEGARKYIQFLEVLQELQTQSDPFYRVNLTTNEVPRNPTTI